MKVADYQKRRGEGEAVHVGFCGRGNQRTDHAEQQRVDRLFTGPAQPQAGQRHTYLSDGKQTSRIGQKVERGLRPGASLLGHLPQAGLTNGK